MVIGDSLSDLNLAENLSGVEPTVKKEVHLLLVNPRSQPECKAHGSLKSYRVLSKWSDLEEVAGALLAEQRRDDALLYLLLDIDRTCIMPRGLADEELERAREVAVNNFVRLVLREEKADLANQILDAYRIAENFPPYSHQGSLTKDDEDVRALATLLLVCGILRKADWKPDSLCPVKDPSDLTHWLDWSIDRADHAKLHVGSRRSIVEGLNEVRRRFQAKVSTVLVEYRAEEEHALLDLNKQGRYTINGHIVRVVSRAAPEGWIPVGYSDRPGASMGLELWTDFRSRPRWIPPSLIECQAPLIFEKK